MITEAGGICNISRDLSRRNGKNFKYKINVEFQCRMQGNSFEPTQENQSAITAL